jgi:hypothetical protein
MHTQIFQRGLLGKYPAVLSLFCIERQRERERDKREDRTVQLILGLNSVFPS